MKKVIGMIALALWMSISAAALEAPANHMVDAEWLKASAIQADEALDRAAQDPQTDGEQQDGNAVLGS